MSEMPTEENLKKRILELERKLYERTMFLDGIPDHMVIQDPNQKVVWANKAAVESVNKKLEDIVGVSCYEFWQQRQEPCEECPILETLKTGKVKELDMTTPLGRTYHIRGNPMYDQKGRIIGAFEYGFDITAQKKTQNLLRQSEKRYQQVVENTNVGIIISQDGMFKFINQSTCEISGYSKNELMSKPFIEFVHPDDQAMVIQHHIKRLKGEKTAEKYALRVVTKEGKVIWVENNGVVITWKGKTATLNFLTDITDQKYLDDALKESEERFRLVYNHMSVGVAKISLDFRIEAANPSYCKMLGYTEDELIGKHLSEITHPDSLEENLLKQSLLASGKIDHFRMEKDFIHKSNNIIHGLLDASLVRDGDGNPLYFLGSVSDITKLKKTEIELQRRESILNATQHLTKVGGWEWDVKKQTMYWTDEVYRIHGFEKTSFSSGFLKHIEQSIDCYDPEDRTTIMEAFRQCVETGQAYDMEFPFTNAAGKQIWIQTIGKPVWEGNEVVKVIGNIIDISERKLFETKLTEAKQQWETTFDAISDWVTVCDKNYNVLRSNKASKDFINLSPKNVVGKKCYEIVHKKNTPLPNCPMARAIQSKKREEIEIEFEKDRWIMVSVDPIDNENNDDLFVHIAKDVTDRKMAEAAKEKLNNHKQYFLKAESLSRMAGAVAHHFNNQLSVILGNLELMQEKFSNEEMRGFVTEAIHAAQRASETSGLMLNYLSQNISSRELLDLSEACRSHLPTIQSVIPENISFKTYFSTSDTSVRAGSDQMTKIINHLIMNSTEAIGKSNGEIHLSVKTISAHDVPKGIIAPIDWEPAVENYVCLEVEDNGHGIPFADKDKIFDPFFTTKFTGRGLGLAVVFGIVKAWEGAIIVEEMEIRGAKFSILLPRASDKAPLKSNKTTDGLKAEQKGGTVLLVEDQEAVRKMGKKMLRHIGFSVLTAEGGSQAVEIVRQNKGLITCVITDLSMPDMDGWETIAALQKIQPGLPMIIASGYDETKVMERNRQGKPLINSPYFLQKPFSMDELRRTLNRTINENL